MDEALWTLAELVAEVATALRDVEPANGQVRAVPDERALRYYTTLGLLDRPAAMRGRTALYGRRHLAQVVAIKRLQAAGRSLAEIQRIVPTLDDRALARASGIAIAPRRRVAARAGFWREAPATETVTDSESDSETDTETESESESDSGTGTGTETVPIVAVDVTGAHGSSMAGARRERTVPRFSSHITLELAPGIVLTLDAARAPSEADADALHAAAAPLLAELRRRRLIPTDAGGPATETNPTAPVAPMSTTQREDEGC